ncbi:MAG: hypothetical protein H5T34_05940 [Candidatus Methanomethyliales bacterium]|nr:hypothetical protein [Candidatus Methanomethylicales archaeon]
MSHPLHLPRIVYLPGRKLLGVLYFEKIVPEAKGVFGSICAKYKIIVLDEILTAPPSFEEKRAKKLIFLDITDSSITRDSLFKELEGSGFFKIIDVVEPVAEGLLIDHVSHPIFISDHRAVIFWSSLYRVLKAIRGRFGTGGEAFLFYEGLDAGLETGRYSYEMVKSVGLSDPLEVFQKVFTKMFQAAGFGRMEVLELSDSGGRIAIYDCFECELGKGEGRPYAAFVRGLLAGALKYLLNKEFQVKELWCLATGYSHCLFELRAQ